MAASQNNQQIASTQVSTTSESVSDQTTLTAQFSNWNSYLSDVRKRYWDEKQGAWYWKIEDVQDADTPNINQLDIPIQPNESVEIRVSAISEVGWPDSILESDWSNVLTVNFPDDISDVLNENDFILQEATQDQTMVQMDSTLNTKGVYQHIDDQFYINNILYKHMDKNIGTSFKGDMNNTLNLFEVINSLMNRVTSLEETINRVKGELHIYLYKNDVLLKEIFNNTTSTIKIECEDYATASSGGTRIYLNNIYLIDDYSISLSNVAQTGTLGLLSNRLYSLGGTNVFNTDINNQPLMIDYNDDLYPQQNNQFIWFFDKDNQTNIYSGITSYDVINNREPYYMNTANFSLGCSGITSGSTSIYSSWLNINNISWTATSTNLLATLHPYFSDVNNIVETGQNKVKQVNPKSDFIIGMKIFFKFNGGTATGSDFAIVTSGPTPTSHVTKQRKLKVYFETDGGLTYQFTLLFSLSNFRQYFQNTANSIQIQSNSLPTGG
jgi:hypothetical protein